jgi:hypothetical protein
LLMSRVCSPMPLALGNSESGLDVPEVFDPLFHKVWCWIFSPLGRYDAGAYRSPRVELEGKAAAVIDVEEGIQDLFIVYVAQTRGGAVRVREVDVVDQSPRRPHSVGK